MVDATCPYVKKIHNIVAEQSSKGSYILIIGNDTHPEVEGIKGWVSGDVRVISEKKEAMGLATTVVLALSNLLISLIRKIIPDSVRVPIFLVIVASFVTIVQFLMEGFLPSLYDALGIYIPLIVVNCIILGRAEAYAYRNPPLLSLFDGIGMGLGFTFAVT